MRVSTMKHVMIGLIITCFFITGHVNALDTNLLLENDFQPGSSRDGHYTSGFRFGIETGINQAPPWLRRLSPLDDKYINMGLVIGHEMYTPDDISIPWIIKNDRPYASWAYMGAFVQNYPYLDFMQMIRVDIGILGPTAMGRAIQDEVHKHFPKAQAPQGWKHQLSDEPGVMFHYDAHLRMLRLNHVFDWEVNGKFRLGNVRTDATFGTMFRIGHMIPYTYVTDKTAAVFPTRHGWYLLGGGDVRGVMRDVFLDGNNWRRSHSVEKRTIVATATFGIGVQIGSWHITLTKVWSTYEFKTQERADHHLSLNVTFNW